MLIISCLIPFLLTCVYFSNRVLPWWSDAGEWLKYANALEADLSIKLGLTSYDKVSWKLIPMWDQNVWQYPPLSLILIALLNKLFHPMLSLKILGVLSLSLQPIPAFLLARKIAKSNFAGLLSAYSSSMMPLYVEMLGWGGYPNLIGFLIIGFTFYTILCAFESLSKKNITMVIILSILITLTHHLTLGIYIGTLILWALLMILFGRDDKQFRWRVIFIALGVTIISSLTYLYTLAWPPQYTIYNEAALYGLRFEIIEGIPWIYKGIIPIIALSIIILAMFFGIRGVIEKRYLTLLFSWSAFPCIATLGFLAGIGLDYNRIFFFAIQPVTVLSATPIALIHSHRIELTPLFKVLKRLLDLAIPFRVNYRRLGVYTLIMLSIIGSLNTLAIGVKVIDDVNSWRSSMDLYGDNEKMAALEWIIHNTSPNDTFVAEELIARWIEGFSARRVYLYTEPRFLFIKGQLERYYIASSILNSNYEIRNGHVRILDQSPYNPVLSPQIYFWSKGMYHRSLFFNDNMLIIRGSLNSKPINITSFTRVNITTSTLIKFDDHVVIQTIYENALVRLMKNISVNKDMPQATINYSIEPLNSSLTLHNATFVAFIPHERRVKLIEAGIGWAKIDSDIGTIILNVENAEITADPKTIVGRGINITLSNIGRSANEYKRCIVGEVKILFNTSGTSRYTSQLVAHKKEEFFNVSGVTYIVLPRFSSKGIKTLDEYQGLLLDPSLKIAYLNDKVIILKAS
ncbi:MAG: hypothetical protein RMJ31_06885 [Nitrososphaerota archaeon]|nr:hypothetical protein [Nitrososphaerota archaeon]